MANSVSESQNAHFKRKNRLASIEWRAPPRSAAGGCARILYLT
jgi:hypothetical protein